MPRRKARVQVALDGTRYIGSLAQPIVVPFRLYLAAALQNDGLYGVRPDAVERFVSRERAAKLLTLFPRLGLAVDDWQGLALKLALAHVPGFQIGQRRGAPKGKISGQEILNLLNAWRTQNPGKSLAAATYPGNKNKSQSCQRD